MSTRKKLTFHEAAVASGLLTPEQLTSAIDLLQSNRGSVLPEITITIDELAAKIVDLGLLSRYQADQLKAGRTKLNLGPYIIEDWIGQGGMGQVFKARHNLMDREVAVKVLPVSKSTPQAIECFNREIRTQAQLDHPNLVRAYDAGHDGNVFFLVTEYVPGTDLRQLVRRQGPLSDFQAANVFIQAARGLNDAHVKGFIHRDIKPGNLLVTPDGVTKVSDLGLVGWINDEMQDAPRGRTVGTPDYLSPELIRSPEKITTTSDVYSLGCTMYYAVTGKVPFPGGGTNDKIRRHLESVPWHPGRLNSQLSAEFIEVIAEMMEKQPTKRLQSMNEVIGKLEPWLTDDAILPNNSPAGSPWIPPPPPNVVDSALANIDGTEDTSPEIPDIPSLNGDEPSSRLQATNPVSSSEEETVSLKFPPRQPSTPSHPPDNQPVLFKSLAITLAIAIPLSILVGVVGTLLVMALLN